MSSKEMVTGGIYIVRNNQSIMKVEVLEITKTSIYLNNLDGDKKFRVDKDDFDYKYFVLEEVEPNFNKRIDEFKSKTTSHYDDVNKMFPLGDNEFIESLPEEVLDLHQLSLIDAVDNFKFEKELPQEPIYQTPEEYRGWKLLEKDLKKKWKPL